MPFLQEAKDAGKTVVLEDRRIDAPEDLYATYIGSDFTLEGRKAADEMCKLLARAAHEERRRARRQRRVSAAIDRGKGFREKMGECGITITDESRKPVTGTPPRARPSPQAFLQKSTDIEGVFAQNDEMGLGAIQALEEAGLKPAEDVKIITVDATKGAFEAMIAGKINTVVECNPLLAPAGLRGRSQGGQRRDAAEVGALGRERLLPGGRGRDPADANLLINPPPPPSGSGAPSVASRSGSSASLIIGAPCLR